MLGWLKMTKKKIIYIHEIEQTRFNSITQTLEIITDDNPDIQVYPYAIEVNKIKIYLPSGFRLKQIIDWTNEE